MIYFDQAASSFPKPLEVTEAIIKVMKEVGANPGRSGHALAREASGIIQQTREKAAQLFGCSDPKKALFYSNATVALNQALKGLNWQEGDHIITTSVEHNSVRRPLQYLQDTYGVDVSYVPWEESKEQFLEKVAGEISRETKLMVITHASNVTGSVLPLEQLTQLAKERQLLTLVDASQTVGHLPVHMQDYGINMLAFPGHKGLLGPQGTGMLLVEGNIDLKPLYHGGTGSFSEERSQPEQWPERLESGTLNTPGIAGLYAALQVYEKEKDSIVSRETMLIEKLTTGLSKINGVNCLSPMAGQYRMPIASFNIIDAGSQEIAMILDSHYNIAVRAGLHCNPLAHQTLQTLDQGVVRASLNRCNTENEIDKFLYAVEEIATAYRKL